MIKIAKRIKGISIEIDGSTKGLDKALKSVNKRSRDLQDELKDVEKLLKFNPGNTELLEQQQKLLGEQVENTSDKLKKLKDAQKDVQRQFENGDIGVDQYRAFQREVAETESKLEHFEDQLQSSQRKTDKFSKKLDDAGEKMKGFGNKAKSAGSTMSASFTAPIIGGMYAVTEGTEDFRTSLSKLEQNAENAGMSADEIRDSLMDLSAASDGTDESVEGLSNLLATGFDKQGMAQAVDALSGAVLKFPETLKFENLAESLQETLATGEATGQFEEMLGRVGINAEKFSKGLKEAKKQGDEQNYVLKTLANKNLSEANKKYKENNEELVESKKSATKFMLAMGDLGDTLTPIVTKINEQISKLVEWFNDLSPTAQKVVGVIAGIVAVAGPLLVIIGSLVTVFGAIASAVAAIGLGPLIGIIAGVVAGIVGLVAAGIKLINNWDTVVAMGKLLWNLLVQTIQTILLQLAAFLVKTWNGILSTIKVVWNLIKLFITSAWNGIKDMASSIFPGIAMILSSVWDSIWGTIKSVWNHIKSFISGLWDGISSTASSVFHGIKDTIEGVWNSISSTTSSIWDGIVGTIKGAINGVIGAINGMLNAISSISIDLPSVPEWVPGLGGSGGGSIDFPNLPNIPKLKRGTNYVEDEGMAYLHEGEAVVPKKYNPAADGSKGGVYEFHFEIPLDGEVISRKTVRYDAEQLEQMLKERG
ncbi:hypothetical protein [Tuberibacillus sp. Marseille-P3662]|uniref:hypothetical protein n=1 Tax=Tuberibacillus sp. Marseille-P3662 TaxID=1965358 RepID=UPI000A1CCE95|nr:hypothetical protein [Tuberibacillus sp. Marseille-P3662]